MRHEDLEKHDGVPSGKYTVGLGQQGLAFCGDREDAVSMALTACKRLLEKHNVSPMEVGAARGGPTRAVASCRRMLRAGAAASAGGCCFVGMAAPLQQCCSVATHFIH